MNTDTTWPSDPNAGSPSLTGPVLRKHAVVLEHQSKTSRHAIFRRDAADGEAGFLEFWLDLDGYEAMGRPEQITITLEPGDVL